MPDNYIECVCEVFVLNDRKKQHIIAAHFETRHICCVYLVYSLLVPGVFVGYANNRFSLNIHKEIKIIQDRYLSNKFNHFSLCF